MSSHCHDNKDKNKRKRSLMRCMGGRAVLVMAVSSIATAIAAQAPALKAAFEAAFIRLTYSLRKSSVFNNRVRASASATPVIIPRSIGRNELAKTCRNTLETPAPRAMRTPIS